MITPFDLHVLSTPPAFILSQDQTLLFQSWSSGRLYRSRIFWSWSKLNLAFSFFTASLRFFVRSFSFSEIIPLPPGSFGIFQGCITVYLSRFSVLPQVFFSFPPATTLLSYHARRSLSSTFFYFFPIFLFSLRNKYPSHRRWTFNIAYCISRVNIKFPSNRKIVISAVSSPRAFAHAI